MGKIYAVMGKSATGKDTIYKELLQREELNLCEIVSYTTRPIRNGEIDGKEYFFVDVERMEQMQAAGKIIECRCYNTVHGKWYYFLADDGQVQLEKADYLVITTLEGYEGIKKYFGKEAVCPIYIKTESGVRLERALQREKQQTEPKYAEMCRRYLADEADFSEDKLKKAEIGKYYENNNVESCVGKIIADIQDLKNML